MKYTDRYESTMKEWERLLKKAEEKLARSTKCFELFGDDDSKQWMAEDKAEVEKIQHNMRTVKERFGV